jgi:peptide/nickel transport system substrate-binding protein
MCRFRDKMIERQKSNQRIKEEKMKKRFSVNLHFIAILCLAVAINLTVLTPGFADTKLRVMSSGDLKILDPIFTTNSVTISHGYLIYDTLFAMNSKWEPKPQMVDTYTISPDGLKYTFTLRKGMKWHDGTPVTAKDAVASLNRWCRKGVDARAMKERLASIVPKDEITFELNFKEKFGPVLMTLANPVIPGFIMREKDALTSHTEQIKETIGSGPFVFAKDEWIPGSKIVYKKFSGYVPRNEPASGYAGGKVAKVDRVEVLVIPDSNTAAQALVAGEIDIIEKVPYDLQSMLKKAGGVELQITNQLGFLGHLRFNTLHPPFNNAKARQALLMAVDQNEFMTAAVGDYPEYKKVCWAIFGCGSAFETEIGAEPYINGNMETARRLMKEAGYDGRKIVILDPTIWPQAHAQSIMTAQALRKIGAKVDLQAMDWNTLTQRRLKKDAPGSGSPGWDLFFTTWPTITMSSPITNVPLDCSCNKAWYGWPCDEKMQQLRDDYFKATTFEEQKKVTEALQKRFYEFVPYINTGQVVEVNAWRSNIKNVIPFMQMVFWNIEKH